jgi:hypothetical protein
VVFAAPGLINSSLVAVANAVGPDAPKTNVARSTLETTPQLSRPNSILYELYVGHVKDEISRIMRDEHYSLTWAVNNAITLVPFALTGGGEGVVLPNELREKPYHFT